MRSATDLDVLRLNHQNILSKGIDKSSPLWYNILVRMREAERQTDQTRRAHGGTANHSHPLHSRATADEDSRWGVAAGILNIKGCGERGNP
jgi:hypothetical protein